MQSGGFFESWTTRTINEIWDVIDEECINTINQSVLIYLRLTAAATAADAGLCKKISLS